MAQADVTPREVNPVSPRPEEFYALPEDEQNAVRVAEKGCCVFHPTWKLDSVATIVRSADQTRADITVTVSCSLCASAMLDDNGETVQWYGVLPIKGTNPHWQDLGHREWLEVMKAAIRRNRRLVQQHRED